MQLQLCLILLCAVLCPFAHAAEPVQSTQPVSLEEKTDNRIAAIEPNAANDQAPDYTTLLAHITPQSSVADFKELWQAYLRSDIFTQAHTAATIPYLDKIQNTDSKEGCQEQLPSLQEQLATHFPSLALHYVVLRCHTLLGNATQADTHEQYFTKLSSVMTLDGDGTSSKQPLWVGSTVDAVNFLQISGYEVVDSIFKFDSDTEKLNYFVQTIDENHSTKVFVFDSEDLVTSLRRSHVNKRVEGNEIAAQTLDSEVGHIIAMAWLAEQGETAAVSHMGDLFYSTDNEDSRNIALTFYITAAELGSALAANRYATTVLEYQQHKHYERALDYLTQAVEKRDCYSAATLLQMYEKSLAVQRDQDIIDGLVELCADPESPAQFYYNMGYDFYFTEGAVHDKKLAADYWQKGFQLGDQASQYRYAMCLVEGKGREKDIAGGLRLLQELAQEDYVDAQLQFGYYLSTIPEYQEQFGSPMEPTQKAAEQGLLQAQYNLGYYYKNGKNTATDHAQALHWYQQAADKNFKDSALVVGRYYLTGTAGEKDYEKAWHYFEQASQAGYTSATNLLGYMTELGLGRTPDLQAAKKYYSKAADKRDRVALANLYTAGFHHSGPYFYEDGLVQRIEQLAAQDDPEAMVALGFFHRHGFGVERNNNKAVRWFKRAKKKEYPPGYFLYSDPKVFLAFKFGTTAPSADRKNLQRAADNGVDIAAFMLGEYYRSRARDVDDDDWEDAYRAYSQAAEMGNADAMVKVAELYEKGLGVQQSSESALTWYKKAAAQETPEALNTLATIYLKDAQVDLAVEHFKRAAELGLPAAMRNLGTLYSQGMNTARDLAKAVDWYKRASDLTDQPSRTRLAELFMLEPALGNNHEIARIYLAAAARRRYHEAIFWLARSYEIEPTEDTTPSDIYDLYKIAAEADNAWAANNMGVMHLTGEAPDADEDDAADFFEKAHEAGNHSGTANLAWCYEHGLGVRKRPQRALRLYRQAADAGSPFALARLAQLAEDPQTELYNPQTAAGYRELLAQTMQNKVVTTAARSVIQLPPAAEVTTPEAAAPPQANTQHTVSPPATGAR